MEAELGSNPSYIWRSIMAAKPLMKEGLRWRVGNGEQVRVWWDKWIPSSPNFQVESPVANLGLQAKVAELIDHNTRSWKSNVLQANFNPQDRRRINQIPIPRVQESDVRVWGWDKLGNYSVKSGYHVWRKKKLEGLGERYIPVDWKRLWQLQLPPKVRVFLWKWGSNILPTGANLSKRIREACDECPFCGLRETQEHILRDCDWAGRIWRPSALGTLFAEGAEKSSEEWLCDLIGKVSDDELCSVVMALWFIWKERNNQYFNNPKMEENEVMARAEAYLDEFRLGVAVEGPARVPRREVRWEKPERNLLKANVDASKLKEGGTGLGLVVRDEEGRVALAAARRTRVDWEPEMAEAHAILWALDLLQTHAPRPTLIESDCKSLIQKLDRQGNIETELGVIVKEIREKCSERGDVCWRFWGRGGNAAAHEMARVKCRWEETELWLGSPPIFILNVLERDCNGTLPV
ncbi:unnamed protein product [Linum trigynum]|uniref:Reverse transcriptase zinc-binding domain-containing protein n=1 Tax=Linum trigynum TaxID=586398 RepID=A0AAV2GS13_9ROSI